MSEPEQLVDDTVNTIDAQLRSPGNVLTSTYRLQLTKDFSFTDAAKIVPYLHDLGISHVYCSPYFEAYPGSMHGYDVCNHHRLNPELGGCEGFALLVEALERHGMGHIVDIVPNHMSASPFNAWWNDVLENGPSSPYATFFDIDWRPVKAELTDKVMLPILGKQYGDALDAHEVRIEHHEGAFTLRYFDQVLPLGPETIQSLLNQELDALKQDLGETSEELLEYQSILTSIAHLPLPSDTTAPGIAERHREKEVIKRRLRELEERCPPIAAALCRAVRSCQSQACADKPAVGEATPDPSIDRLDRLLGQQSYRLCYWRSAADEINYRRFFDVNELAALCMESADVFAQAHALVARLIRHNAVAGLRIDHIDGLFAPRSYLLRLQWLYLAVQAQNQWTLRSPKAMDPAGATSSPAGVTSSSDWNDNAPALLQQLCRRYSLPEPAGEDLRAVLDCIELEGTLPEWPLATVPATRQAETAAAGSGTGSRTADDALLPVYVEKILGPDEPLPADWPTTGTTGYDALNSLNGLFVSPTGLKELVRHYARFTGSAATYDSVVYDCKASILRFSMSSELQMLAHRLNRISEQHRGTRDFTLNTLRHALREILACFPVYRVYTQPGCVSDRDRQVVNLAVVRAKRRNPAVERSVFDFVRDVLLLEHPPGLSIEAIRDRELFVGRFQQVTSPVAAKGVEDTAFYVFCPLISVNEVGGDPYRRPALSVESFHGENIARCREQPRALLATSTHDTKRSEDVRARIDILSEAAPLFRKSLSRWARLNKRFVASVDGEMAPSTNDQYLFYQTLVGVWPLHDADAQATAALTKRLQAYMEKATHEAKQHTSWVNPNPAYDQAVGQFVCDVLRYGRSNRFVTDFISLQRRIQAAGLFTALSQVVLKLTMPGVPDVFQGQELWDFSLVDPDNRHPVDYARREQLLTELKSIHAQGPAVWSSFVKTIAQDPRDPRLKLLVHWRLLQQRLELPDLFLNGDYEPLAVSAAAADHVVAFQRTHGSTKLIVLVGRLYFTFIDSATEAPSAGDQKAPISPAVWGDATVELPGVSGTLVDALTGREQVIERDRALLADLFCILPIVVLIAK